VIEALLGLAGSLVRGSSSRPVVGGSSSPSLAGGASSPTVAGGSSAPPLAVGLAVPGLVHDSAGSIVYAANLGLRNVGIGTLAQERLGLPIAVMHDVRAAAVAEGLLGAARGCSDYLLLTLGTGVGAAVVIGGRPYTGAHGIGGELGHVAVEPRGPVCGCGRVGCLEALASAGGIGRRYEAMGSSSSVSTEEIAARAGAGDPVASQVWREALDALALAIVNYATLLDPELVVIGGGMAAAGPSLFDPLRERVRALARFGEPCPIVPAALGEDAGRVGAAIAAWRVAGIDEASLGEWAA
jgi:glucokinase